MKYLLRYSVEILIIVEELKVVNVKESNIAAENMIIMSLYLSQVHNVYKTIGGFQEGLL